MKRILTTIFTILMVSQTFASDLTISVEREGHGFLEQTAMVYERNRLLYATNSNFLCGPQSEVFLGQMFLDIKGWDRFLKLKYDRHKRRAPSAVDTLISKVRKRLYINPHTINVYVDGRNHTKVKYDRDLLAYVLQGKCDRKFSENAQSGVMLKFIDKSVKKIAARFIVSGHVVSNKTYLASEICKKGKGYYQCLIPGYGHALLKG